uniref:hypothetical protein n=1 Tax=Candidatus Electrothrix sp. TaxID=2170559 RepID=UPI0040570335
MHLQAIIACLKADMHQGAVAEQNLKQIQRIRSTIRAFPRLSFSLESHTSNTFVSNSRTRQRYTPVEHFCSLWRDSGVLPYSNVTIFLAVQLTFSS